MFFNFGFSIFSVLFLVAFFLILSIFIVMAVKGLKQWSKNNHAPRLTVNAVVVAKRADCNRHHHSDTHHTPSSTFYYATFQVESGDRIELPVAGYEYGPLVEGDKGNLTFQGTRFLAFERT